MWYSVASTTPAAHSRSGVVYDKYIFQIFVARRPLRVIVSKVFPTFLMVSSTFAAETLAPQDAASRYSIIITLMLAVVFLNADTAGSFEELTLVSTYAIASLIVLVLCILEVAVAKALVMGPWSGDASASLGGVNPAAASGGSALDPYAFDMVAWQVLLAAWVAINAGFAFRALQLRHKRHRLHTRDEEHKGHLRARCRAVAAAPVTPQ